MLTADMILRITKPGDLFSRGNLAADYHDLCKKWHPDVAGSEEVMAHINELHDKAEKLLEENRWEASNFVRLAKKGGGNVDIYFKTKKDFELGSMYINGDYVIYLIHESYKKFYDNAVAQIGALKYANSSMESEVSKYMPTIVKQFETADGMLGLVISKTPDLLLLDDVIAYYGEAGIPHRHAAWIISSLYNIACYFDWADIVHNGITPNSYFISPKYHSGALLGGWWFTGKAGDKTLGMPKAVYDIITPTAREAKVNVRTTNMACIKYIGRTVLADPRTALGADIPRAFIDWVYRGTDSRYTAVEIYSMWEKVIISAYGERKFVVLDLTAEEIYK